MAPPSQDSGRIVALMIRGSGGSVGAIISLLAVSESGVFILTEPET